jgi:hypothetical protein
MRNLSPTGLLASRRMPRRRAAQICGLPAIGLTLPQFMAAAAAGNQSGGEGFGRAKSVILFWLLGGPPQHETWDPKPEAPEEIRGEFGAIDSVVPGIRVGELMPLTAQHTDKTAILRAVVTKDQAHSSSGYQMLTGVPHSPLSAENVTARAPNLAPSQAAMVRALKPDHRGMPSAIVLPHHIANDGEIVWPGQDAGVLGKAYDPWQLYCDPSQPDFHVQDLAFPPGVSSARFDARRDLLAELDRTAETKPSTAAARSIEMFREQAFQLLSGGAARKALKIDEESAALRERYGTDRFGQSTLLARRLVQAGVSLVQVNWTRVAGGLNNGTWDTHREHCQALKSFLMPMMDRTFSALLGDLHDRGMLDETLVVWVGEFGHTPKLNANAGRDHWGNCFSVALAGGGVRGGIVHGESDQHAAFPVSGVVTPADITATIFHALGFGPETLLHDQSGRPFPVSRGRVVSEIFAA